MDISPYKVAWVEFDPLCGIVTKHDRKMFGEINTRGREKKHYKHFSSREEAVEYLNSFDKPLDKCYYCRIFTDKQFAYVKENGKVRPRKWNEPIAFTKKQYKEFIFLRK